MNDRRLMLAYTLWHWPRQEVERTVYEAHHRRFHGFLAHQKARGFKASQSTRVASLPWTGDAKDIYQDRYFVDSWSVFEGLESHATSGVREEPHRQIASVVSGAVAGMYGLRMGSCPRTPRWNYWFAKPDDMTYEDLEESCRPVVTGWAALWGRRLVLGPTPEFCVESETRVELPGILRPLVVRLEPVWNSFDEFDRQRGIESRIIT